MFRYDSVGEVGLSKDGKRISAYGGSSEEDERDSRASCTAD